MHGLSGELSCVSAPHCISEGTGPSGGIAFRGIDTTRNAPLPPPPRSWAVVRGNTFVKPRGRLGISIYFTSEIVIRESIEQPTWIETDPRQ
jgi:hypothetical protein